MTVCKSVAHWTVVVLLMAMVVVPVVMVTLFSCIVVVIPVWGQLLPLFLCISYFSSSSSSSSSFLPFPFLLSISSFVFCIYVVVIYSWGNNWTYTSVYMVNISACLAAKWCFCGSVIIIICFFFFFHTFLVFCRHLYEEQIGKQIEPNTRWYKCYGGSGLDGIVPCRFVVGELFLSRGSIGFFSNCSLQLISIICLIGWKWLFSISKSLLITFLSRKVSNFFFLGGGGGVRKL